MTRFEDASGTGEPIFVPWDRRWDIRLTFPDKKSTLGVVGWRLDSAVYMTACELKFGVSTVVNPDYVEPIRKGDVVTWSGEKQYDVLGVSDHYVWIRSKGKPESAPMTVIGSDLHKVKEE